MYCPLLLTSSNYYPKSEYLEYVINHRTPGIIGHLLLHTLIVLGQLSAPDGVATLLINLANNNPLPLLFLFTAIRRRHYPKTSILGKNSRLSDHDSRSKVLTIQRFHATSEYSLRYLGYREPYCTTNKPLLLSPPCCVARQSHHQKHELLNKVVDDQTTTRGAK